MFKTTPDYSHRVHVSYWDGPHTTPSNFEGSHPPPQLSNTWTIPLRNGVVETCLTRYVTLVQRGDRPQSEGSAQYLSAVVERSEAYVRDTWG